MQDTTGAGMRPLGYVRFSEAWYARVLKGPVFNDKIIEEFHIGDYINDGRCVGRLGEFRVEFWKLQGDERSSPRLCMYSDAWAFFDHPLVRRLVEWMRLEGIRTPTPDISPDEFEGVLRSFGFTDNTEREFPENSGAELLVRAADMVKSNPEEAARQLVEAWAAQHRGRG